MFRTILMLRGSQFLDNTKVISRFDEMLFWVKYVLSYIVSERYNITVSERKTEFMCYKEEGAFKKIHRARATNDIKC